MISNIYSVKQIMISYLIDHPENKHERKLIEAYIDRVELAIKAYYKDTQTRNLTITKIGIHRKFHKNNRLRIQVNGFPYCEFKFNNTHKELTFIAEIVDE